MGTTTPERPVFTNHGSTMKEQQQGGEDADVYEEEPDSASGCGCGCGCFRLFGFGRSSHDIERTQLLREGGRCKGTTWWMKKLDKVKRVSEVLAGPKWKNFIRKIGGYCKHKKQRTRFQYDPHSYALNFDGGTGTGTGTEEDHLLPFSSRFSAPPVSETRQTGS